ncbi:hypothetical protein L1049_001159 [Liquidambar formosana]|uniref:GBF-interacting protein 1 N-terminal domain-containing protein n=1 Tax=Liquidambar formosana TaxID=63359 RepID=A0AAP0NA47_LIQFO
MSGGSRVSIPNSVRKTIQDIKEIAGKHSDEDIYAMLKECSMDPNETAQKLLYLDTFHEVKRKRERRKENLNSRASEDSRWTPGVQGRGARGARGNYPSHHISYDVSGGKNAAARKENGVNHTTARGALPVSQKMENKVAPHVTKSSTIIVNGTMSVANGSSSLEHAPQASVTGVSNLPKDNLAVEVSKLGTAPTLPTVDVKPHPSSAPMPTSTIVSEVRVEQGTSSSSSNHLSTSMTPTSVSGVYSSASDPVLLPSLNSRVPGVLSTIRREVGSQRVNAESSADALAEINHIQMNKHVPQNVDDSELSSSISEKAASGTVKVKSIHRKIPRESKGVDKSQLASSNYDTQSPQQFMGPSKVAASEVATILVEPSPRSLPELNVSSLEEVTSKLNICDGQHVIFPNHFQVPEAFKNGLTFGSFDGSFGLNSKFINGINSDKASVAEVDSFQGNDEAAVEASLSNQNVSSTAQEVDYPEHPQSPQQVPENISPPEGNVSTGAVPTFDQSKQEILLPPGGPQFPVQTAPNYFGYVPPMLGSQHVQFEGSEPQARDVSRLPNFASGNSLVLPTSGPTPPATQPTGVGHNSLAVPPQPVPVFRQPYPPNYLPYNPYYSPYFVPPVQQYLSHGGFPQQPSTGNVYLPPPAVAAGVKFSFPQYKPGANSGNSPHIGVPSGYGSYSSSAVPYSPSLAATSGSSTGNEDLSASHLKENNIYTTGQQTEGSAVWIPAPGRDMSGLQSNSFYNLPPQGQHVPFSPAQAGHGAFAGIYHPTQTMAGPSTVHPLLQQSQAISGSVETVGHPPPSGSYQQPQNAQMNWNSSY